MGLPESLSIPSAEHLFSPEHCWDIAVTSAFAAVTIGEHRLVTTNPAVIAFLLDMRNTARLAHYESVDGIPTEHDHTYEQLTTPRPMFPPDDLLLGTHG